MKKICRFGSLLIALLVVSGCTNLSAVRQYSETANGSLSMVPDVVDDFTKSCKRRAHFQPSGSKPNCEKIKESSEPLTEVVSVLQKYTQSLGKLASDEVVTYTENLDSLEKEINSLEKFDKEKISAVTSIAKYLSKLATDVYRRDKVKDAIQENNQHIKVVTSVLADIIKNDYKSLLETEGEAVGKYYKEIKTQHSVNEPLAVKLAMKEKDVHMEAVDAKSKAIAPLTELIKKIGTEHDKLNSKSGELDSKEVIELVKSYVDEAKPILKQVKQAYK
ncbi:hypothetical protein [Agarilytica rhodophyticola]|uniref:hypothetical protein n=1 Tax=Agarilytica rhodophyticola TaxID=1737490 RepID=UPI000CD8F519|nr:hypothetical protein [Agarilytica rhodophyticola]